MVKLLLSSITVLMAANQMLSLALAA